MVKQTDRYWGKNKQKINLASRKRKKTEIINSIREVQEKIGNE